MTEPEVFDSKHLIREVFQESHDSLCRLFFILPAERYKEACTILGIYTDLNRKVNIATWESTIPYSVYDSIYQYLQAWYLNEHDDGEQMPLPFEGPQGYKVAHGARWRNMLTDIITKLSHQGDPTRWLLRMYVNNDSPDGNAAEQELLIYLREEYPLRPKRMD